MNDADRNDRDPRRRPAARRAVLVCAAVAASALCVVVARARLFDKQQQCVADDYNAARLFESGGFAKAGASEAATPAEIKLVSYNMRWRGGKELDAITKLLRDDMH